MKIGLMKRIFIFFIIILFVGCNSSYHSTSQIVPQDIEVIEDTPIPENTPPKIAPDPTPPEEEPPPAPKPTPVPTPTPPPPAPKPSPPPVTDGIDESGGIFLVSAAWKNGLHTMTVENLRYAAGYGDNLTHWHQGQVVRTFPHLAGMVSMVPDGDSWLYLFDDRNIPRTVYLYRDDEEVWSFNDDGECLNPRMDFINGDMHIWIPDRANSSGHFRLRHWINMARQPDIMLPEYGVRIYERLVIDGNIIIPVTMATSLGILTITPEEHRFEYIEQGLKEPPRNMFIFRQGDSYAVFYLRPTELSDRATKGIIGEIAMYYNGNIYSLSGCATHWFSAKKVNDTDYIVVHNEVDGINWYHLSGEHKGYTGSYLTIWRIDEELQMVSKAEMEPFINPLIVDNLLLYNNTSGEVIMDSIY